MRLILNYKIISLYLVQFAFYITLLLSTMDKRQEWIRLQVVGGAGFNFVLPANPNWKVSQLQEHMIQIYNQIASCQQNSYKAIKVNSIRRKGYFIAPSLRVGSAFSDWDQITCNIVIQNRSQEDNKSSRQSEEVQKKKRPQRRQQKQVRVTFQIAKNQENKIIQQNPSKSEPQKQVKPLDDLKQKILKGINKMKQVGEKKQEMINQKNNRQKQSKELNKQKKNQIQTKRGKQQRIRIVSQQSDPQ